MTDARLNRARRSLEGLATGDGFGERFFGPLPSERIATRTLSPGPWRVTDDTMMALSLVEVLATHGAVAGDLEQDALAAAFGRRYLAEPGRGYGPAAHGYLPRLARGEDWRVVAREPFGGTGSMGNGSAMRVAPLGAFFADEAPARIAAEAAASAAPTHAHPEGAAGAVAIALAAAWRAAPGGRDLFELVLEHTPGSETWQGIVRAARLGPVSVETAVAALGNGSRVICPDTVPFALWCVSRFPDDYEEALWLTVSGLGDRDTTCAIVGGVLASGEGIAPPAEWVARRERLEGL
ncbi:MAG: ADP-ribosylglycohydrolase family protein [Planctomycetota bacterium]